MDTIMQFVQWLMWAIPFVVLCLATRKENLSKTERGKQFAMPFIALVYCVVVMIFIEKIIGWINGVLGFFLKILAMFTGIDLTPYMMFIANIAILMGFIAIKGIALPILKAISESDKSVERIISAAFSI